MTDMAILLSVIGALFTVSMALIGVVFGIIYSRLGVLEAENKILLKDVAAIKALTLKRRSDDLS